MRKWVPAPAALLLLVACSGGSVVKHEELASEMKQIRSLDAEGALLWEIVLSRHSTHAFARGEASYLHEAAKEHQRKLARARAAQGAERELERTRAAALGLIERIIALRLQIQ